MRGLLKIYNTDIETNELQEIREFRKGSWINLVKPVRKWNKKGMWEYKYSGRFY